MYEWFIEWDYHGDDTVQNHWHVDGYSLMNALTEFYEQVSSAGYDIDFVAVRNIECKELGIDQAWL